MSYRVLLDGVDIMDLLSPSKTLIHPNLTMELNTSGSLDFTMPPHHEAYDAVRPLLSTLEVYEDQELIWFGRPVEIRKNFYAQKQVYCEGALSFFNDSVQRLREYNSINLHTFFRTVIANHNLQIAEDRQFDVGQITVPDRTVYRKLNYEATLDVLRRQCLNAEGGYFFLRRENGRNVIDWLLDVPYDCNQPVEFGLNLMDLITEFDGSSIATCVLPLGETDSVTGLPLTIEKVNNGSDVIESEAVSEYGRITKAVSFNGVRYASTLYKDGIEYLQEKQFSDMSVQCSAAELHLQNPNFDKFRIGQKVRCHSIPHLMDRYFPLIQMTVQLDSAAKQITLGSVKKPTLTEIEKETQDAVEQVTADMLVAENIQRANDAEQLQGFDMDDLLDAVADKINSDPELFEAIQEQYPEQELSYPVTGQDIEGLIPPETLSEIEDKVEEVNDKIEGVNETVKEIDDYIIPLTDEEKAELEEKLKGIAPYLSELENALMEAFGGDGDSGDKQLIDNLEELLGQLDDLKDTADTAKGTKKLCYWVHQINGVEADSGTINFVTN